MARQKPSPGTHYCATFKPFTARNFRENLSKLTGQSPADAQAHHNFPRKFEDKFKKLGIDIHDPRYGSWWETKSHQQNARAVNRAWERFLRTFPTRDQAIDFGRSLAEGYGLKTHF